MLLCIRERSDSRSAKVSEGILRKKSLRVTVVDRFPVSTVVELVGSGYCATTVCRPGGLMRENKLRMNLLDPVQFNNSSDSLRTDARGQFRKLKKFLDSELFHNSKKFQFNAVKVPRCHLKTYL